MSMGKGFLTYATATILNAVANGYSTASTSSTSPACRAARSIPRCGGSKTPGYLTSKWEKTRIAQAELRPRRAYYELTRAGREALAEAVKRYRLLEQNRHDARPETSAREGVPCLHPLADGSVPATPSG